MESARTADKQSAPPRLRVSFNTAAPLTLTSSWQAVAFKKTGTYDVDTFPNGGRFDAATNKLVAAANETEDRQYDVEFFFKLTAGLLPINDIHLRFVVPRPTADGGPIYFPFPDGDGFVNVGSMLISPFRGTYKQVLYFSQVVRQYGIQLQMRAGADLLIVLAVNRPVLVDAALSLFAR